MAANSTTLSSFSFNATTIPAVGSAAISYSRSPLDTTPIGEGWATFLTGVGGATVALDLYFNAADHDAIKECLISATVPTAFEITWASGSTSAGDAIVTQFDIVASVGDVVRANAVLQCSGAVT